MARSQRQRLPGSYLRALLAVVIVAGVLAMHGLTMSMATPIAMPSAAHTASHAASPLAMPTATVTAMSDPMPLRMSGTATLATGSAARAHHLQMRSLPTPGQAVPTADVLQWSARASSPTTHMHQCVADVPRAVPGVVDADVDGAVLRPGPPVGWGGGELTDHGPAPPDLHVLCVMRT